MAMTVEQIAYIAGIVDGEANISIRRIGSVKAHRSSFYCYMNVSNTSKVLLDRLLTWSGLGYINGPYIQAASKRRPYWKWHVRQSELLPLLEVTRHLLIVKKRIVSLVFAMRELQSGDWRSLSQSVLNAREEIFTQALEANRRGRCEKEGELLGSPERTISSQAEVGIPLKVQRLEAETRPVSNASKSALPERDDIV